MRKYFLTGLATLLPLTVTIVLVLFIMNLLTKPFMGIVTQLLSSPIQSIGLFSSEEVLRLISQLLILVTLFLFLVSLGWFARRLFVRTVFRTGETLLHKIPIINQVYKTAKDIVQSLFSQDSRSFQQVVMLPFPYAGAYCLGLITNNSLHLAQETTQEEMVSVFILTTPNPTTGYLVLRKKSDLIYLRMKSDEAIKYVVSCGVIQPS